MDISRLQMVSLQFRRLIEHYEQGPRGGVALSVYRDSRGIPTIGWGHRILPGEDFSRGISPATADDLFDNDAGRIGVRFTSLLERQPTQQQWDGLFGLAYNVGWQGLENTHIIQYFNDGNDDAAANEFPKWNHSGGKVLAGLTYRRHTEQNLYLTGELIFYNV